MATSFAKNHIGKSLDEDITATDLTAYFATEREESLTLEFKSYYARDKPNFDGVLRTVAAFLNSEGGLLIFGAPPETTVREKHRVVKGNLTPIPTNVTTKDSLVRSISDNISYLPIGIRVNPVLIDGSGFVYLIEVQESPNKPHQYSRQYPIRLDGQSVGAPHYLVEALIQQIRRPELEGFLRVVSYKIHTNPGDHFNSISFGFEITIFNVSSTVNDTDVYIQVLANSGTFLPGTDASRRYDLGGKKVTRLNAASLITNGLPTKHKFDYLINTQELNDLSGRIIKVTVGFGGTNSTTKFSYYSIKLRSDVRMAPSDFGRQFTELKDLKSLLDIQRDENVSSIDRWQGREEQRMEAALNGI